MLDQKTENIISLKNQLKLFKQHLKEEQFLNNYCSSNFNKEDNNFEDGINIEKENKNTLM